MEYDFSDWLGDPIDPPICVNCSIEMEWQGEDIWLCPVCKEEITYSPTDPYDDNSFDPDEEWHER